MDMDDPKQILTWCRFVRQVFLHHEDIDVYMVAASEILFMDFLKKQHVTTEYLRIFDTFECWDFLLMGFYWANIEQV